MRPFVALPALALASLAGPAFAVNSQITIDLGQGDVERRTITYECEGRDPLTVTYINAAPNFIALLPLAKDELLFVAVTSASGARYASGQWVWETKGPDGRLLDLTLGADAAPIAECFELNETP